MYAIIPIPKDSRCHADPGSSTYSKAQPTQADGVKDTGDDGVNRVPKYRGPRCNAVRDSSRGFASRSLRVDQVTPPLALGVIRLTRDPVPRPQHSGPSSHARYDASREHVIKVLTHHMLVISVVRTDH